MEEKLREEGKPVPPWLIEARKMPSCSAKLESMGVCGTDQREKEAMERVLQRNRTAP